MSSDWQQLLTLANISLENTLSAFHSINFILQFKFGKIDFDLNRIN